jgi:hypothetical protein
MKLKGAQSPSTTELSSLRSARRSKRPPLAFAGSVSCARDQCKHIEVHVARAHGWRRDDGSGKRQEECLAPDGDRWLRRACARPRPDHSVPDHAHGFKASVLVRPSRVRRDSVPSAAWHGGREPIGGTKFGFDRTARLIDLTSEVRRMYITMQRDLRLSNMGSWQLLDALSMAFLADRPRGTRRLGQGARVDACMHRAPRFMTGQTKSRTLGRLMRPTLQLASIRSGAT